MTIPFAATTTLACVIREHPEALGIFDRLGIDYCCHGHETVEQGCARVNISLDTLGEAFGAPANGLPLYADWAGLTMSELCDDIEATHHALARNIFTRLSLLLSRVLAAHGEAHPDLVLVDEVVSGLREEMIDHMVREERVLFPWLRRLERPGAIHTGPPWSVKRPIDCMMHDHDSVGNALERLRRLTNGFVAPPGTCGAVDSLMRTLRELASDTRLHIHKENNILFPAGVLAEAQRGTTSARENPGMAVVE